MALIAARFGPHHVARGMRLPAMVSGTIVVTIVATLAGFIYNTAAQDNIARMRLDSQDARTVQLALLTLESGARGFVISTGLDDLEVVQRRTPDPRR